MPSAHKMIKRALKMLQQFDIWLTICRSGRQEVFYKDVLKNSSKFTGKHLYQSLLKIFIKKETQAQMFSCEF